MHATGTSGAVGVLFSTQHASSVSVRANGLLHNRAVACILILVFLMCTSPIFLADIKGVSTVRAEECRMMSDTANAARVAACALSKCRCCRHLLGCSKSIGPPPIFFYHTACHTQFFFQCQACSANWKPSYQRCETQARFVQHKACLATLIKNC